MNKPYGNVLLESGGSSKVMIAATRLFAVIDQITQVPIMSPAGESRHSKRVDHLLNAEVPNDKHNVDAAR